MRIYLASLKYLNHRPFIQEQGLGLLYSWLREKIMIERHHEQCPAIPLMVDSGAHSWNQHSQATLDGTTVKLPNITPYHDNYVQNVKTSTTPSVWVELDVYFLLGEKLLDKTDADVRKTNQNYMRVYHPFVDKGTGDAIRKWIDHGHTWIGIGGDALPMADRIFAITQDKVKVHGFAQTRKELLRRWPYYSVDSTTWMSGPAFGCKVERWGRIVAPRTLVEQKDVYVIQKTQSRVTDGIKAMADMQHDITSLWNSRGVKWV